MVLLYWNLKSTVVLVILKVYSFRMGSYECLLKESCLKSCREYEESSHLSSEVAEGTNRYMSVKLKLLVAFPTFMPFSMLLGKVL
jgi:hypothetical protein